MLLAAIISPAITAEAKQNSKEPIKTIVIDPSGQKIASKDTEPIGPGAFKSTPETSPCKKGKKTGYKEYELNLQVSEKLKDILSDMGYEVLITRNKNDVSISNSERAMIANEANADILVVISAGDEKGTKIICQSDDNPYNYGNYENSRLLSDAILGSLVQKTCNQNNGVDEQDDKAIINWCACPTAIVQVGNLEDKEEEELLVDDEYQKILAEGIAAGIESYYSQK